MCEVPLYIREVDVLDQAEAQVSGDLLLLYYYQA